MYGLLLEAIVHYLKQSYGEEKWEEIRRKANLTQMSFATHERYSENVIPVLARAAAEVTGESVNDLMDAFGVCFVSFVAQYGYDRILKVLGRHLRDFLNGLDNLHEYLRFSYPKLRAPSFFCENESKAGLTLHYRSKRRGYLHYVKGQIRQVAKTFYKTKVDVDVVSENFHDGMSHIVYKLHFDNTAFREATDHSEKVSHTLPLRSEVFFELFPFHIVFNRSMVIRNIGAGLMAVMPTLIERRLVDVFRVTRPIVGFTWDNIMGHTNNVFELISVDHIQRSTFNITSVNGGNMDDEKMDLELKDVKLAEPGDEQEQIDEECRLEHPEHGHRLISPFDSEEMDHEGGTTYSMNSRDKWQNTAHSVQILNEAVSSFQEGIMDNENNQAMDTTFFIDEESNCLHLKGQMMYMPEWDSIIFLGTPIMESLDTMFTTGLYINDLSMHDSSRDLVLAGTQQSAELKLALDQEQQKSKILEESMRKLDAEMKRTDQLLYQMIPKAVADRLRRGEPAINTCQVFDNVTILFSDVVGFTTICSQIYPMEVVSMLNAMYTKFDKLSEEHNVYKVETIGDAYMVVCGAPDVTPYHSLYVCDMALDMLKSMMDLRDPSTGGNMKIRVGVHSGNTVAGVVGIKMPRYCLFGDTVNTASRMETNGEAMKIHISETTYKELKPYPYVVQERGTITVKGKGTMKTYWLLAKNEEGNPMCPFSSVIMDELAKVTHSADQLEDVEKNNSVEIRTVYSPVSFADVARSKSTGTTPMSSPVKNNTMHHMNSVEQYQKPDGNISRIIEIKPVKETEKILDNMKYSNAKINDNTQLKKHRDSHELLIRNAINNNGNDQDLYRSQTCVLL